MYRVFQLYLVGGVKESKYTSSSQLHKSLHILRGVLDNFAV